MIQKQKNNMRSVRRCFHLLELFSENQKPLKANAIAQTLEAPLSSIADLLKCLQDLGYVAYDNRDRTYFMTSKIATLGHWMTDMLINEDSYLPILEELHKKTRETVCVFWQNSFQMKCVTSLKGLHPLSLNFSAGESVPIIGSAVGYALLAQWEDTDIEKLLNRFNQSTGKLIAYDTLLKTVEKTRKDGYAYVYDDLIPEVGAISVARPIMPNKWLIFSVGGSSKRIKKREVEIRKLLKKIPSELIKGK